MPSGSVATAPTRKVVVRRDSAQRRPPLLEVGLVEVLRPSCGHRRRLVRQRRRGADDLREAVDLSRNCRCNREGSARRSRGGSGRRRGLATASPGSRIVACRLPLHSCAVPCAIGFAPTHSTLLTRGDEKCCDSRLLVLTLQIHRIPDAMVPCVPTEGEVGEESSSVVFEGFGGRPPPGACRIGDDRLPVRAALEAAVGRVLFPAH